MSVMLLKPGAGRSDARQRSLSRPRRIRLRLRRVGAQRLDHGGADPVSSNARFSSSRRLAFAQRSFDQNDWTEPFPAHRIIGPVYYVGTADLACFLITCPRATS